MKAASKKSARSKNSCVREGMNRKPRPVAEGGSVQRNRTKWKVACVLLAALGVAACNPREFHGQKGIEPLYSFPVTDNSTPYSRCLADLSSLRGPNTVLPTFAVGEVADKTGKIDYEAEGHKISQGVSEMVMSALGRTGMVNLVERFDLRIPLAEMRMAEQNFIPARLTDFKLQSFDFLVLGAVTELNFNIVSGGVGLAVAGVGANVRNVVINVALDLRVVDRRTFAVRFIRSLQKQIYGYEVEANVFRFFGTTLVEFEAGNIKNEPIQLGLRSVVEMGVYQIMTDFLGLPAGSGCSLETGFFQNTPAPSERVSQ